MSGRYYNENDPYAARWLRNLGEAGHIAKGHVDERSIVDVRPEDVRGFDQCHFFAGIGGWPYALELAGWSDDIEVWTGSCPCQPFSCAGQRRGESDERHLWPVWRELIAVCKPPIVFGEQVASRDGREWLAAVRFDLETLGYACGAADLCAASTGAPHIRQRLFFVAHRERTRLEVEREQSAREECTPIERGGEIGGMEHAAIEQVGVSGCAREQGSSIDIIGPDGLPDIDDNADELGDSDSTGPSARCEASAAVGHGGSVVTTSGGTWAEFEWLPCRDGKWRPTKPGLFPLAHGVSARVGRLRAYGNAIVPQIAAEFIRAAIGAIDER